MSFVDLIQMAILTICVWEGGRFLWRKLRSLPQFRNKRLSVSGGAKE